MSLVLTRRPGETLMIGDDVTVTVVSVSHNQVKIAVNAPKEIAVHREEIYLKVQQEKAGQIPAYIGKAGILDLHPCFERREKTYSEIVKERQRIKDLEATVKEQALLISTFQKESSNV